MDPIKNPFSPGAGSPPQELVGREAVLQQVRILLGRIKNKRSEKNILLIGLRGVGKTVLLNEIKHLAKKENYQVLFIEAQENKGLGSLLVPYLQNLLFNQGFLTRNTCHFLSNNLDNNRSQISRLIHCISSSIS